MNHPMKPLDAPGRTEAQRVRSRRLWLGGTLLFVAAGPLFPTAARAEEPAVPSSEATPSAPPASELPMPESIPELVPPPPAPPESGAPANAKPGATPQASPSMDEGEYFLQLNEDLIELGSSLTEAVVSSTKTAQRGAEAPAVVTVITRDELRLRGYTSLAEAIRSVPGFYDVYDLVTHNVGVRGVNGGARASGSLIKLMIDGQPVDFRPSTGNFFGEELIPMGAVERIEIIRGPASAIYGANAFLGVINVLTVKGKDATGTRVTGRLNRVRDHLGGGGELMQGFNSDRFDGVVALSYNALDRSGLRLPISSPILQDSTQAKLSDERSTQDDAKTFSFFGRTSAKLNVGTLTFFSSIQDLNAAGEFLDTGPLVHKSRVALSNQNFRLSYEAAPSDFVDIHLALGYSRARPSSENRLSTGEPDYVYLRQTGADGYSLSADTTLRVMHSLSFVVGADALREDHRLQTFDRLQTEDAVAADGATVVRAAGTVIPGEGRGRAERFMNYGAFAQSILRLGTDWSLTGGARVDWHNIYGMNPAARAGVVYAPIDTPVTLKLLYGSSFKAPSAEQLYTYPMDFLDIQGNPKLKAQTANTLELVGGYGFPDARGEVVLNFYFTQIKDRVEFLQRSLFLEAQNTVDEWLAGGELDTRFAVTKSLHLRLTAGLSRTVKKEDRSPLAAQAQVTNPLFPLLQLHLLADYVLPVGGLRLSAETSYISARSASQPNAIVSGQAYRLPAYVFTAMSISTPNLELLPDRETTASMRATNLLNTQYADSGFGGVDVPALGTSLLLSLNQTF